MARKAAPRAGKRKDARQAIIESALTLAASRGWLRVGLGDIAEAAEVSLAELRAEFSSRNAIVAAYIADIDRAVLDARDPEMAGRPATERLFDVLMKRFDLLNAQREGVVAILRSSPSNAEGVLCGSLTLRRSMRWMLEAADLSSAGLRGEFRVSALCALYLTMLRVWLHDDSEDMARTMAVLDRRLRRLDRLTRSLCRLAPNREWRDTQPAEAG
ncbi:MAG: TetR family transcriptional regulator [Rhodospirillales bacterium]|nr:TetR family transcriptional regulator [Rhodospirillales bacterium]